MSKAILFVPYVNRPDLLKRVLVSLAGIREIVPLVIDNSKDGSQVSCNSVRAPVPMTFTQTQNWMLDIARERNDPFYLWAHCDAIFTSADVMKLHRMAESETTPWGVIFTNYDVLCAYRTDAVQAVGGYDTNFFDYCSDQDFYRRLRLAGYSLIESHIPVQHDKGSSTLRADPEIARRVGLQVGYRSHYYRAKHGGDPGNETFMVPFNGSVQSSKAVGK